MKVILMVLPKKHIQSKWTILDTKMMCPHNSGYILSGRKMFLLMSFSQLGNAELSWYWMGIPPVLEENC